MLKKIGIISALCFGVMGCGLFGTESIELADAEVEQETLKNQPAPKIRLKKTPDTIIICRNKQCAPSKLSTSKEYIYNTLLHMLDSNARKKALVCQADANTHVCTEEYISLPITVGITPAYMYIDDVKITDVSLSPKNTAALDLILNWGVSYNGQTPTCRPSKTLLYVKNVNNVVVEDNGYECKMTTIGSSTVKTLFAIDYIDLDYDYIGGFYSIGVSGPAFGGDSGYMLMRLPEDISVDPKDFQPAPKAEKAEQKIVLPAPTPQPVQVAAAAPAPTPQPVQVAVATPAPTPVPVAQPVAVEQQTADQAQKPAENTSAEAQKSPAPNVDTIIRYNHAARDYDSAKASLEKQRKEEYAKYQQWNGEQSQAIDYKGVKVLPVPLKKAEPKAEPVEKNKLNDYQSDEAKK